MLLRIHRVAAAGSRADDFKAATLSRRVNHPCHARRPRRAGSRGKSTSEDTERLIEEVRGDDPELARYLRIEDRGLEARGLSGVRARRSTSECLCGYGTVLPGRPGKQRGYPLAVLCQRDLNG